MCSLYAHPRKNLADKLTSLLSCQIARGSSESCRWFRERKLVRSLNTLCEEKRADLEFEEIINDNINGLQATLANNQFNKITILKHIFEELESLKIVPSKEQSDDLESSAAEDRQQHKSNYGEHLLAYLQESCLRAAKKAYWKTGYIEHQHSELDLLSNAREQIALGLQGRSNVFNKFDWRRRTGALETYIRSFLELKLVSEIEKRYKIQRRTPWGWLKHINGPRQRPSALRNSGVTKSDVESYELIWQCFDEIYASVEPDNNNRLPEPSEAQYEQMTKRYNQLRDRPEKPGIQISCEEYIDRLKICSDAAKAYGSVFGTTTSLDSLKSDDGKNTTIDIFDETNTNNLEGIAERELLIEEEKLLKSFLDKRSNTLKDKQLALLELKSLGFNQTHIAKAKGKRKPDGISKRYKTIYTNISKDFYREYLVEDNQKDSSQELDAEELGRILKPITKMVKFNLDEFHKQEVDKLLATIYINGVDESQKLLHLEIHEKENEKYSVRLNPTKQCLVESLRKRVKDNKFDIPSDAQETVTEALSKFVEDWLEENSPQQIALIAEQ